MKDKDLNLHNALELKLEYQPLCLVPLLATKPKRQKFDFRVHPRPVDFSTKEADTDDLVDARFRMKPFEEGWTAPGMEAYDDL